MFTDLTLWLLATSLLGIFGLPLFNKIYSKDVTLINYSLSIPFFLIINGLISWLIFLVSKNYLISNILSVLLLILISSAEIYKNKITYKKNYLLFLYGSALLSFFQLLYLGYRSFNPDLIGTEKIMDFMMLSSVFNAYGGEVKDLWFSGSPNPYYYFGYWIYASILKLSVVNLYSGYNFILSVTFALTVIISASISYHFIDIKVPKLRKLLYSSVAPIFIVFISNFYILFEIISRLFNLKNIFNNILNIDGFMNSSGFFNGSSWRSTRVINFFEDNISRDYTITEYPSFTFLLGDLHPHLISIPFVLFTFFLIFNILKKYDFKIPNFHYFLIGFLIPVNGFINIWDVPFLIVLVSVSFLIIYKQYNLEFIKILSLISLVIIGFFISILVLNNFYFSSLSSQSKFPIINVFPFATSIHHFFIVMGPLLILFFIYVKSSINIGNKVLLINIIGSVILILIFYFLRFFILGFENFNFLNFFLNFPLLLILFTFLIISFYLVKLKSESQFVFIIITSCLILIGVENFRVIDLFDNRMNTIFKSYFQVWILVSLFAPMLMAKLNLLQNSKNKIFKVILISIFTISIVQFGSNIYYSTDKFIFKKTLDSSEFIEDYHEGALNVVDWISTNTEKEDIIFYEVGNDYEITSFFSSFTGRSSPIGWPGHQKQWGRDPVEINSRVNDLRDYGDNLEILNKYNVNYLITKNTFLIKNKNFKQVYTNTNFSIYLIND